MCRKGIVIYVIMSCLVVASAYGCKTVHDVSQQKVHGDSTEIAIGQVPAVDSVQVAVGKGSMMFTEETMRNAIMECRLGMSRSHAYEKVTRYEKLEIAVNDVNPLDTRKRFSRATSG